MIEIKKNAASGRYELVLDGIAATEEEAFVYPHKPKAVTRTFEVISTPHPVEFSISLYSKETGDQLLVHRFSDLPDSVWKVDMHLYDYSESDGSDNSTDTDQIIEEVNIYRFSEPRGLTISFG